MKQGHRNDRGHKHGKPRNVVLTAFCAGLVVILLGMGLYVGQWYLNLGRIRAEGERYARMYGGRTQTAMPPGDTPVPAAQPTQAPTVLPSATPEPTAAPTPSPTPVPAATLDANMPVPVDETLAPRATAATPDATRLAADETLLRDAASTLAPSRVVGPDGNMPVPVDEPIPTPDGDTLIFALPTAPPVQDSFKALLAANPETVGFLEIGEMLSLPVVQRPNDNEYYLDHSFEGAKALEGTLFLDGMNRLVPEDDCLIIYGHNMKNRTMFGRLSAYGDIGHLHQHPVVHFDTIYENRSYVAFAAFSASMAQGDSRYFDVRNFIFDEDGFDKFVLKLQSRSVFKSPVDVRYGDRLLLLVTCDYSNREGRFILALRQLREDENEGNMFALMLQAEMKQ